MQSSIALFLSLLAGAEGADGGACATSVQTGGLSMLQRASESQTVSTDSFVEEDFEEARTTQVVRSEAQDARFLMQASFGPTRKCLMELQAGSYEQWIQEQMGVASETHREYYRQRVNPRLASNNDKMHVKSPCDAGARWIDFVFTKSDKELPIKIEGKDKIIVNGTVRSFIDPATFPSQWASLAEFSGFICYVEEGLGGAVHVAELSDCKTMKYVTNPLFFSSEQVDMQFPFNKTAAFGVSVLQQSVDPCPQFVDEQMVVKSGGKFYRYDPRVALRDNSMGGLFRSADMCIGKTPFNQQDCHLPQFQASPQRTTGLDLTYQAYNSDLPFPSDNTDPALYQTRVDSINVDQRDNFPGHFTYQFAATWTGFIEIETAGSYTFFVSADQGSRLQIDGKAIVNKSDGQKLASEEVGEVQLEVGSHAIRAETYQTWGDAGMILQWSGPGIDKEVVPSSRFHTMSQKWIGCLVSCGSPGEVASDPALGHQFQMITLHNNEADRKFDNRYAERFHGELSKSIVWVNRALRGQDQLRQRMAWALSQIFVVSTAGIGFNDRVEIWLNYYDIFVRHAFGSFFDIVKEVTYSPLMGRYLTHEGSTSYKHNKRYPNENFAREVMQLFTIGLTMLKPDGSIIYSSDGAPVQAYTNDQILVFSRIFTGFKRKMNRANIEQVSETTNMIDPMWIKTDTRDIYPKVGLSDKYIGDGYPLCSASNFLGRGARYEFQGTFARGDKPTLVLNSSSALYQKLCASPEKPLCDPRLVVELDIDLPCLGEECDAEEVFSVHVGEAIYSFVPPPCVHMFYQTGQIWVLPGGKTYAAGSELPDMDTCKAAFAELGLTMGSPRESAWNHMPHGCVSRDRLFFNTAAGKTNSWFDVVRYAHVVVDDNGNVMEEDVGTAGLPVVWSPSKPPAGFYKVEVVDAPVFSSLPSREEALSKLAVGAHPPIGNPFQADSANEVRAYSKSGTFDGATVIEVDGKYFLNWNSVVHLMGENISFRNPPVFLQSVPKSVTDDRANRAAHDEVDALLKHLVHHQNTAVFIAKRLIQRFGVSSPSHSYVQDVQAAFRSGGYGQLTMSGKHGDLGATLAAILLHEEVRNETSDVGAGNQGALREPLLKILHLLRAMEYEDRDHQYVVFKKLQDTVGQFPFESPTVFNFYLPEYELPIEQIMEPEAEAESEEEEEKEEEEERGSMMGEKSDALVAPELQILTPAYMIGYLNGIRSVIRSGVGNGCIPDTGLGVTTYDVVVGSWKRVCPQGELKWEEGCDPLHAIDELDVLLTGGRLSPVAKASVLAAFEDAREGHRRQAAQQALVMTAEFNTLGNSLPKAEPRLVEPEPAQSGQTRQYKALVILFLNGGADTFNMLVPKCSDLYMEYKDVRTNLALTTSQLISIPTVEQVCDTFGVHQSFRDLASLYKNGQAAFISNVGNLAQPQTREEYKAHAKMRCVGDFSHSDGQRNAQTLKCQDLVTSGGGGGGRIADALAHGAQKFITSSFSLAGGAVWPNGLLTKKVMIDANNKARFDEYEKWRGFMTNVTMQTHGNPFADAYSQAFRDSVLVTEKYSQFLDSTQLKTNYDTTTSTQKLFHQVAKLVASRETRRVERDLFYMATGGWDHHKDMISSTAEKFKAVNDGLKGFVAEMVAQGIWENVVFMTMSEFGRTLESNGEGSDHAWSGNHIIASGSLMGGRIFNRFHESLAQGNSDDLGRGRLIPHYPWESVVVPIAEWLGVDVAAQGDNVFPNLRYFNSSHVIDKAELFKS